MYDDIYERVERIVRARGRKFWLRFTRIGWEEIHASGTVFIEVETFGQSKSDDLLTLCVSVVDSDTKEDTLLIFLTGSEPREIRKFIPKIELLYAEESTLMPLWLKYRNYDDPELICKELSIVGQAGYDPQHPNQYLDAEYFVPLAGHG